MCGDLELGQKALMLIRSQALLPPTSAGKLWVAVENLGIPCFLAGMARGLLGRNHPLHFQQNRRAALKKADVVVLAGAVCHFRLSYGCVLSCSSKIIVVLINSDIFWKPQEAVQGDVAPCGEAGGGPPGSDVGLRLGRGASAS